MSKLRRSLRREAPFGRSTRRQRAEISASWKLWFDRLEDRTLLACTAACPSGVPEWIEQGPGPITGGEIVQTGAVQAIATDPGNANTVIIGTVNGGIWKTEHAYDADPNWEPKTDQFESLSIGSIAYSPISSTTVYAGTGNFSSFAE